jgi:prepilin-type N-terminal cleavage/methylation domain-containing protein
MLLKKHKKSAFTLVEVLLVVVLISILSAVTIVSVNPYKMILDTKVSRANLELKQMADGFKQYHLDNLTWPSDSSRGTLPTGMEPYMAAWPEGPFGGVTTYDWDNFTGSDGEPVRQISIRFCTGGASPDCDIPSADWSSNFDEYSSYYFCMEGICRAHPGQTDAHPAYCVNCP